MQVTEETSDGVRHSGSGVTGDCEPPVGGAEHQVCDLWENSMNSELMKCLSSPGESSRFLAQIRGKVGSGKNSRGDSVRSL